MSMTSYEGLVAASIEAELRGLQGEFEKLIGSPLFYSSTTAGSGALGAALALAGVAPGMPVIAAVGATMGLAAGVAGTIVGMAQIIRTLQGDGATVLQEKGDVSRALSVAGSPLVLMATAVGVTQLKSTTHQERMKELDLWIDMSSLLDASLDVATGLKGAAQGNQSDLIGVLKGELALMAADYSKIGEELHEQTTSKQAQDERNSHESAEKKSADERLRQDQAAANARREAAARQEFEEWSRRQEAEREAAMKRAADQAAAAKREEERKAAEAERAEKERREQNERERESNERTSRILSELAAKSKAEEDRRRAEEDRRRAEEARAKEQDRQKARGRGGHGGGSYGFSENDEAVGIHLNLG